MRCASCAPYSRAKRVSGRPSGRPAATDRRKPTNLKDAHRFPRWTPAGASAATPGVADAVLRQHGLADPYVAHRKRPLADNLADFGAALSAKGNSPDYVALVLARIIHSPLPPVRRSLGIAWRSAAASPPRSACP